MRNLSAIRAQTTKKERRFGTSPTASRPNISTFLQLTVDRRSIAEALPVLLQAALKEMHFAPQMIMPHHFNYEIFRRRTITGVKKSWREHLLHVFAFLLPRLRYWRGTIVPILMTSLFLIFGSGIRIANVRHFERATQ